MRRLIIFTAAFCIAALGCFKREQPKPSPEPAPPAPKAETPVPAPAPAPPPPPKEISALPPDTSRLPVPPDGWYSLELAGEKLDVFRDQYGVPHVFAPSPTGAFRAQGYVIMEDRFLQALKNRDGARGMLALTQGASALPHDQEVYQRGYTDAELKGQVDALRPELKGYLEAYVGGINDYIQKYAPQLRPWSPLDTAAQAVYMVSTFGDGGDEEKQIYDILELVKTVKSEEFMNQMLNDCVPLDVLNAPTTDHTYKQADVFARSHYKHADFDPSLVLAALKQNALAKEIAARSGLMTAWGSNAWVVAPGRSASGKALLFGGPMMGFGTPQIAVQVHLVAPELNVIGMCFPGLPGIQIGHNERLAWTTTSGGMNQTDLFVEELNPENQHQYRYQGAWKDMEMVHFEIAVRNDDGTVRTEPYVQYRTVHGPVVQWDDAKHRAYTRCTAHRNMELQSFMAFTDFDFAQNFDQFEKAVGDVASSHNFFAADVDGNIGYWLAGRVAQRHPDQDPRLPTPGTGEYDWQGMTVVTDDIRSINPPEGWFGNWNNKPSAQTPGWFPEMFWGIKINESLAKNDALTWEQFLAINQENGEHSFLAFYFKPYLLDVVKARKNASPVAKKAASILQEWPDKNVTGQPGSSIFNEWMMEVMTGLFSQDFGPLVKRSADGENLRVFGTLAYRVLMPEKSGIQLSGDYLHGRKKDDVAYEALDTVLTQLTQKYGEDMSKWSYDPGTISFGELGTVPRRAMGTYCIAAEMSDPIRAVDLLPPGQSGLSASPHFGDQLDLFKNWQYKEIKYQPVDFGR